jgi:hypothetical protein
MPGITTGIKSVREIWSGREGSIDQRAERTYVRAFRVVTTDPHISSVVVIQAEDPVTGIAIPEIFDTYEAPNPNGAGEEDTKAICYRITPRQDNTDPEVWIVACQYSNTADFIHGTIDPLTRPPEVRWGKERYTKVVEQAYVNLGDANPTQAILNTAGDLFATPPTKEDMRSVLYYTRNESSFNSSSFDQYSNAVNTVKFLNRNPGIVKCEPITADQRFENNIVYWSVKYQFHINPDGWQVSVLNRGRRVRPAAGQPPVPYSNIRGGEQYATPALLAADGTLLPPNAVPVYLKFNFYPGADLNLLNLTFPYGGNS